MTTPELPSLNQHFFPEVGAGGATRFDGTLQFYLRIGSLLRPDMIVLDLGAGRGGVIEGALDAGHGWVVRVQGRVRTLIAMDIDETVSENPYSDEQIVYDGKIIPLPAASVDLIICDNTLEHIADADVFSREVARVLRPGGWFCARTPYLYSLLTLAASVLPNRHHAKALSSIQPGREERDIFPTAYKLNTISALKRQFPSAEWDNASYTYSPEPAYHFNNKTIYRMMLAYQYLKKPILGGEILLVFLRKKASASSSDSIR